MSSPTWCKLCITITQNSVAAEFGGRVDKGLVSIQDIIDCYLDTYSGIYVGEAWWFFFGRKIKPRIVYSILEGKRVVLSLKNGKEFVFSTHHPEHVINIIKERIPRV